MYACLVLDPASSSDPAALDAVARACSPRVGIFPSAAVFDASGLSRVIGTPAEIAAEVSRLAESHGLIVRVAIARTMTAAWLLAHARSGRTVAMGDPARELAALPVGWLGAIAGQAQGSGLKAQGVSDGAHGAGDRAQGHRAQARAGSGGRGGWRQAPGPTKPDTASERQGPVASGPGPDFAAALAIFERWGLRTMGDVARLPRADLLTRLGPVGVRLHQSSRGEDTTPLVPTDEAPRFGERLELEWPIEGLEPLSFVLGRLCDALSLRLERADRGAVVITTRLGLVTHTMHVRTLQIPSPMRDARTLRTLITLDLESHPPPAAIDVVEVDVEVTPGRIVQGSLLTRPLPTAENLATLLARLGALMGTSRVGAPALVDSHDERAMTMTRFAIAPGSQLATQRAGLKAQGSGLRGGGGTEVPPYGASDGASDTPGVVVRRFRHPLAARVDVEHGLPVRVSPAAGEWPGGRVVACAGPWRSSGQWWALDGASWERDEWDVEIAGGLLYRLARDRATGQWAIDAVVD